MDRPGVAGAVIQTICHKENCLSLPVRARGLKFWENVKLLVLDQLVEGMSEIVLIEKYFSWKGL